MGASETKPAKQKPAPPIFLGEPYSPNLVSLLSPTVVDKGTAHNDPFSRLPIDVLACLIDELRSEALLVSTTVDIY